VPPGRRSAPPSASASAPAVSIAVVTAHDSSTAGPLPAWSSWSPPDTGTQGAIDIANHLSPFYRLSQTDQLDAIDVLNVPDPGNSASSVSQASNPIVEVALQQQAPRSSAGAVQLLPGHTIAYNLCGLGVNDSSCLIGEGTPSSNRLLLLRREALELALYTFRYLPNIQNVVAILPPGTTQQTSTLTPTPPSPSSAGATPQPLDVAVLYDRQELQQFTQVPLSTTLPLKYPPSVAELPLWRQTADAAIVDQLTARAMFSDQIKHTVDGNLLLLLTPIAPQ
jgi:hypothetical protein